MTLGLPGDGTDVPLEIDLRPLGSPQELEPIWLELEERADASFFLSWAWIGPWLDSLPAAARPHLLTARAGSTLVGLAVLCPRTVRRLGILPARCWFLHESGDPVFDRVFMEYNGILADRGHAAAVTEACFRWLRRTLPKSDELILGGLDTLAEGCARRVSNQTGDRLEVRSADLTQWVDLDGVRRGGEGYRAMLGRNTRSSIRRAARLYIARGRLGLRIAGTVEEALADFDVLESLHQAHWKSKGRCGAFDNPHFRPFHQRLIRQGVPAGTVRMCRVMAGAQPIGILYNFVHRGSVLNYQGGFAYESDNRLKPGMLSHVMAIEDALDRGERCYDFMSTPSGHKPLLSNAQKPMHWIAIGPDSCARQIDARLRRARAQAALLFRRARRSAGLWAGTTIALVDR